MKKTSEKRLQSDPDCCNLQSGRNQILMIIKENSRLQGFGAANSRNLGYPITNQ
ncbi:hypothetical protein [Halothiobacillus sp.]|uniref:hypothetical protein n=1 Tax=Halothiobacillus sp. TaxID=1891311 RepID=UPI00262FF17E|nr:hypothetical protein [Halothiobacillus sp.]